MELTYSLGTVANIITAGHISLRDDVSRTVFHNIVLLAYTRRREVSDFSFNLMVVYI